MPKYRDPDDVPDRWDLEDHRPVCMEDDCTRLADWRSEDGYPFCNMCAYNIYAHECELENLTPHTASQWMLHGRPHGPIGSTISFDELGNPWSDVEQGRYDDDPNPYHGDYSEM